MQQLLPSRKLDARSQPQESRPVRWGSLARMRARRSGTPDTTNEILLPQCEVITRWPLAANGQRPKTRHWATYASSLSKISQHRVPASAGTDYENEEATVRRLHTHL